MGKISFEGWEPGYVSHSTISGYLMCGRKTLFTKVMHLEEKPGWAALGGNAVHSATEAYDRQFFGVSGVDNHTDGEAS